MLFGCTAADADEFPLPECTDVAAALPVSATVNQEQGVVSVGQVAVPHGGTIRVFERGSPITEDYRPDRLNLETDDAGMLLRAYCG